MQKNSLDRMRWTTIFGAFYTAALPFHGGMLVKQSTVFLWLSVFGVVVPWFFLAGFLGEPQPTVALFFSSIFANQAASSVAADLFISAFVFFRVRIIRG